MDCSDENIITLILTPSARAELEAVKCLKKCEASANGVLWKLSCRNATERRSIVQEAVTDFFINVRQGKFALASEAKICSYVAKVATYKWYFISRQNKAKLPDTSMPAVEFEPEPEDNEQFQAALLQLSDDDREILTAFYFYDQPLDVYAEQKGISHDAAKKRISRVRERLKDLLKPPKK